MEQKKTAFYKRCATEMLDRFDSIAADPNREYRMMEEEIEKLKQQRLKKVKEKDHLKNRFASVRNDSEMFDCFKAFTVEEAENVGNKPKIAIKRLPVWLKFEDGHSKAVIKPAKMARWALRG